MGELRDEMKLLQELLQATRAEQMELLSGIREKVNLLWEKLEDSNRLDLGRFGKPVLPKALTKSMSGIIASRRRVSIRTPSMEFKEEGEQEVQNETVEAPRLLPLQESSAEAPSKRRISVMSAFSNSSKKSRMSAGSDASIIQRSTEEMKRRARRTERRLRESRIGATQAPERLTKAQEVVFSPWFSPFITLLILVNVILLGVEVDISTTAPLDDMPRWFFTVNASITCIFVMEIALKFVAYGCKEFWLGEDYRWNIFDFAVMVMSVADLILDMLTLFLSSSIDAGQLRLLRAIRLARALRGVRVVRLFRQVEALRTLMLSIMSTMGSLFWTLAMLILLFYSFGVVLTSLVVEHCRYPVAGVVPECPELLYRYWSSVPESMLTLFMAISGGVNWDDAIRPLRDVSLMALVLMVVYVFITVFAVLNVVTGVFCNTAIQSAQVDKDVATIRQVHTKMQQAEVLRSVFQEIDTCHSNEVTYQDVKDAISLPELAGFLESVGISTDDVWTFFMLLDQDKSGSIDLDEFVSGCLQLHGPAKSMQMAKMSFENKLTRQAIKALTEDLQGLKQSLAIGPRHETF